MNADLVMLSESDGHVSNRKKTDSIVSSLERHGMHKK